MFAQLSKLAGSMCAPFWWSLKREEDQQACIRNNGTICYLNTGGRELGITANHVYQKYLEDLAEYGDGAVECQFGGSTIRPEQRALSQSEKWDLAAFDVPNVFVSAAYGSQRTQHHPGEWPPVRPQAAEVVLYGGYPGILRAEDGDTADLPFQWVLGSVNDVGQENIVLEPNFEHMTWQRNEVNADPGGMSGGPVFRVVEGRVLRLELVGFIHEFSYGQAMLARHADCVTATGALTEP